MSCVNNFGDINETFIIEPMFVGTDVISACTAIYTSLINSCSGNTSILLNNDNVYINGSIATPGNITGDTLYANNVIYTTQIVSTLPAGPSIDMTSAKIVINGDIETNNNNISAATIDAHIILSAGTNLNTLFARYGIELTGGTFNNTNKVLTLTNANGSSIIINGFTDYYTTGVTFVNNLLTIRRNDGQNVSTFINNFSGLTVTGTLKSNSISATTISANTFYGNGSYLTGVNNYYTTGVTLQNNILFFDRNDQLSAYTVNLSSFTTSDYYVTGGTYTSSAGTITFKNNSGSTFDVSGFFKPSDDTYTTGFTFNPSNYDLTIKRNNGLSDLTQSLAVLASDLTVTGGTYNPNTGIATFTNNTGGTFNVSGFTSGLTDTIITNFIYSSNTFTISDSSGRTFSALFNTVTGLTVNGNLTVTGTISSNTISATTISVDTYQNLPRYLSAATQPSANTLTIVNSTGGTFNYIPNAVTGGTYSNGIITLSGTGTLGSITGLSTLTPITLYSGNGALSGNRVVDIDNYTLNFSSSTLPNALVLSGSSIGIGKQPSYKLDVDGDINFPTTTGSTYGVLRQNGNRILHTFRTDNVFLGANSGNFTMNVAAQQNTSVGVDTLRSITIGTSNVAIGYRSLSANTLGSQNVSVGRLSLSKNTLGENNTSVGDESMSNNTFGNGNVAIGIIALKNNTTGSGNVSVGGSSSKFLTTGNFNTAVGASAMYNNVSGDGNTVLGTDALHSNNNSINVAIGNSSLYSNINGQGNVAIGSESGYYELGSNKLHIANSRNKTLIYGEFDNSLVGINTTSPTNALTVSASTDPLKLINVQSSTDSEFLTIDTNGVVHKKSIFFRNQTFSSTTITIEVNDSIFNPSDLTILSTSIFIINTNADYYVLGDLYNNGTIIVNGTLKVGGVIYNYGTITGPGIIE